MPRETARPLSVRDQFSQISLRNDILTILSPGDKLYGILKSRTTAAWRRVQAAQKKAPDGPQKQ